MEGAVMVVSSIFLVLSVRSALARDAPDADVNRLTINVWPIHFWIEGPPTFWRAMLWLACYAATFVFADIIAVVFGL